VGRRKRGWNAASGLSLNDLRRMLEEKEGQLSGLAERRDELAAELAEVEAELAAAGGAVRRGPGRPPGKRGPGRPKGSGRGPGRPPKSGRGPGRPKGSGKGKPGRKPGPKGQSELHNAIRAVLKGSAEPMKLVDVAAKVKSNGYKTKSKNFGVILGLRLSEMADVKRVERGVYSMR
jgi:DNA-binding transcriptional MerR regulator